MKKEKLRCYYGLTGDSGGIVMDGYRRFTVPLLFVVVFLLCNAGCGRGVKTSRVIRFSVWSTPQVDRIVKVQIEAFRKIKPDVTVEYQPVTMQGYQEKIQTQIAGGDAPDVFYVLNSYMWKFTSRKVVEDLLPFLARSKDVKLDDYYENVLAEYYREGKLYAFPDIFDPIVLFYNKKLFDDAGIGYPVPGWTWDEFVATAKSLTKRDGNGNVVQYGFGGLSVEGISPKFLLICVEQNGGRFFDEGGTRCLLDSPKALEAIKWISDLCAKFQVTPKLLRPSTEISVDFFLKGRMAMLECGRWFWMRLNEAGLSDCGLCPPPMPHKGEMPRTLLSGRGLCIPTQSKQKEAAWEFLKFLIGKEGEKLTASAGDSLPTLKSLAVSREWLVSPDEKVDIYFDLLTSPIYYPALIGTHLEIERIMNDEIERMCLGLQPPEKTAEKMVFMINRFLESKR
jgi:multiple sugar transport system substrate-binding protein